MTTLAPLKTFTQLAWVLVVSALTAAGQVEDIIRDFHDRASEKVLVVAHRADWRGHPENSLPAIRSALAMGVDIIEIDVRRTRDGVLVLMHDDTLDRTTTGQGLVSDHTAAEVRALRLRDGLGSPTALPVPTLEEGLLAVKGRAMINLDRCFPFFAEALPLLEKTGTLDHAIWKSDLPVEVVRAQLGAQLDGITFMPIINLDLPGAQRVLDGYLRELRPVAVEVIFSKEDAHVVPRLKAIRASGARLWLNALWPHHNAGHDDERAVDDPDGAYGWLLAHGINLIQTDRPALLLDYLRKHGRR